MKNVLTLLLLVLLAVSCKNDNKKETVVDAEETTQETDNSQDAPKLLALNGEFLFDGTTGVMQIGNNMYAVKIDEKAKELIEQCKTFKENKFDFVRVAVDGIIVDNPEEGWDKQIIVKRIINVRKSNAEKNITIKSSK